MKRPRFSFHIDLSKVLPSRVEGFLRRVKREMKWGKPLSKWLEQFNRHSHGQPRRPRVEPLSAPPEFREPTAIERLAAVADPEIKEWVDAYDRYKAAGEEQMAIFEEQQKVQQDAREKIIERYEALKQHDRAINPEWKAWQERRLDMRYNPLANDEDISLPIRYNPLAQDEDFFIAVRDAA